MIKILEISRYFIVAPSEVRPGQVYRIVANLLYSPVPLKITATLMCNEEEIAGATEEILPGDSQHLLMQVKKSLIVFFNCVHMNDFISHFYPQILSNHGSESVFLITLFVIK